MLITIIGIMPCFVNGTKLNALSRRFGYSLGIDIIPFKICSYDCVYCQLGKTIKKTNKRKSYIKIDMENFRQSLISTIKSSKRIDYITFAGSGEPTLKKDLGNLIDEVKKLTDIPAAVLTNGSLLHRKDVIGDIGEADLIKISLDAPDQKIFELINIAPASQARGHQLRTSRSCRYTDGYIPAPACDRAWIPFP